MRIILAGGGTGGHITPILTVAQTLKAKYPKTELIYVGEKSNLTERLIADSKLRVRYILAGKFRRFDNVNWLTKFFDLRRLLLNLRDIFKLGVGFLMSLWLLIRQRPNSVFIKGGYVGLPVGLAAWVLGIPMVIHESDAAAGIANRILAPLARHIAISFPAEYYPKWQKHHLVFTGNPIRAELFKSGEKAAHDFFKLKPRIPTLLVVGGSGGAAAINQAIWKNLKQLTDWQIIHQTGSRAKLSDIPRASNYRAFEFLGSEMGLAYRAADVAVCRAGMNTLAEIAAFGIPAVVVPHPHVPRMHQIRNAAVFDQEDAAIVLSQEKLAAKLVDTLAELKDNLQLKSSLQQNIKRLAKPDAAARVVKLIVAASR